MMQPIYECINCNSRHVVPNGRTADGIVILHCMECDTEFREDDGTQLFDGDEFDAEAYGNKDITDDLGDL